MLGLGEFQLDAYAESEQIKVLKVLFWAATFFIMIVFLNILIAIMGDAFAQATEDREIN